MEKKYKVAVISMDVEDWYHLDYFRGLECNLQSSYLDGLDVFSDLIGAESVNGTFFVVSEIADSLSDRLIKLQKDGNEIASHGWGHVRPLELSLDQFRVDVKKSVTKLSGIIGCNVIGYRAPCFSMDRARLDVLKSCGIRYDSSKISFKVHPLYGSIDMSGFESVEPLIYRDTSFYEFEVGTYRLGAMQIPISGGGYLRILPWRINQIMLSRYMRSGLPFIMYIHPFELSLRSQPCFPPGLSMANKIRFSIGRSQALKRIKSVIRMLKDNGYKIKTFRQMVDEFDCGL
jgi:hypothetical protein